MARTSRTSNAGRDADDTRMTGIGPVHVALQPIVDVPTGSLVGAEALARFPEADRPIDQVFAQAYADGLGEHLEAECIRAAIAARDRLPDGAFLSVNVSPDALTHPAVSAALDTDLHAVIVEITEQEASRPAPAMLALQELRRRGARIAVDDATTGYAGLTRLARVRPDLVKLDRSLVHGVHDSIERAAVVSALVTLTRRLGGLVLGEGVESLDDVPALAELDVDYAQGAVIGPPAMGAPAVSAASVAAFREARRRLLLPEVAHRQGDELHRLTAALAGNMARDELAVTMRSAAASLTVDVIGLSMLVDGSRLTEITATGAGIDHTEYAIDDFPATAAALATGAMIEAHVDDPDTDPAERAVLQRLGFASLLLVPLIANSRPLGVLELNDRARRRWTVHDLAQARMLADHLAHVLTRLDPR